MAKTKLKEVIYNNVAYDIPDWVKFLTTDLDSEIYGWELKPEVFVGCDFWCDSTGTDGKTYLVSEEENDGIITNWTQSLKEL